MKKRVRIGLVLMFAGLVFSAERPNIIHIMADDMGWGDLACYGNRIAKTPNLDRLASEGTRFTQYYQMATVCSPSRSSILTGRYPARMGVHMFLSDPEAPMGKRTIKTFGLPEYLDPELPTVAGTLRADGYATAHFGKWHLGEGGSAPSPLAYGFDEEVSVRSNGKQLKHPYSSYAQQIVDHSISFIERNKETPFYLNVWFKVPHTTMNPTEEQMGLYKKYFPKVGNHRGAYAVYYGSISEMDRQIGRLVGKLEEMGLSGNTLVVFTSDNGAAHQYAESSHSFVDESNGPFRGRKRSLYEGGIRVPFIVRWPGKVPAGRVDNESVICGADWFPTVCKLTGTALPKSDQYAGENVKDILMGATRPRKTALFWEWRCGSPTLNHLDISPTLAVREGKWKFLVNHDGSMKELYDVTSDPIELQNQVLQQPEVARELEKKLFDWQKTVPQGEVWGSKKSPQDGIQQWLGF